MRTNIELDDALLCQAIKNRVTPAKEDVIQLALQKTVVSFRLVTTVTMAFPNCG
jgi:Arc/MetJ family transcription regulator